MQAYANTYASYGGLAGGSGPAPSANHEYLAQYYQDYYREYYERAAIEESNRIIEGERQKLEAELQAKLDQVAADVELIESINNRRRRRLKRGLAFVVFLLLGGGGAAGWAFTTRVRPEIDRLHAALGMAAQDQAKLERRVSEQMELARQAGDRLEAARAEIERLRKSAPPPAASAAPAAVSLGAAKTLDPKPAAPAPAAKHHPSSGAIGSGMKNGKCTCAPSDPVCGCLP